MYNCNLYWTLPIIVSTIIGFISISVFASLTSTPIGITVSEIGLKICAIAVGIIIIGQ